MVNWSDLHGDRVAVFTCGGIFSGEWINPGQEDVLEVCLRGEEVMPGYFLSSPYLCPIKPQSVGN